MHVDRSRFLLLTASLAAAACNQPQRATSPDTGGAEPAGGKDSTPSGQTSTSGSAVWLEIEPGTEDKPQVVGDGSCDNLVGKPATCVLSPPAGHCENFDVSQRVCSALPSVMQPRAAEAAIDCMLAANGSFRVCEWELTGECIAAGMQATCVEPSTRSECDSISSQCGGSLDVFSCQMALSSVKPQHLSQVASCVREFCEVSWCVNEIAMF